MKVQDDWILLVRVKAPTSDFVIAEADDTKDTFKVAFVGPNVTRCKVDDEVVATERIPGDVEVEGEHYNLVRDEDIVVVINE